MHRRGDDNTLKHIDFALIDIIMMQLSCVLIYWLTGGSGIIYSDPDYRLIPAVFMVGQVSLALFSDNLQGVLCRNNVSELYKLLFYILELWLCCALFFVLVRVPIKLWVLLLITLFFLIADYFARMFNKYLHSISNRERRKVVLVTSGNLVRRAIARINHSKTDTKHEVIAVCLTDRADPLLLSDLKIPVFSTKDPELLDKLVTMWIDDAFFLAGINTGYLSTLIEDFVTMGVTVHYSLSEMNDFASVGIGVQSIGDYKVITNSAKLISSRAALFKRCMDILGATAGLLATAVLFLFIAPAIYIKSPGPIFFKQKRIGRNGKVFNMYKFRSMYMDAEKRKAELLAKNKVQDGLMFKMDDDPRIIGSEKKGKDGKPKGIGNFIRNTSIDEFPQFFNVLKGEMSLVGTRPPTLDEWEKYSPHHRARMSVKPGITGMWQISGRSEITDFEEVIMLDRKYLETWSPMLDIEILVRTVMVVLKRDGAS